MKMNTGKKIAIVSLIVLTAVALSACEVIFGDGTVTFTFNNYSGKAVNIKADAVADYWKTDTLTLESATIYLYPYDSTSGGYSSTASYNTTVSSTGTFTFTAPDPGRYKLTGSKTGWTFVPRYIEVINSATTGDDLYAYPTDASEYTIIAGWKTTSMDIDLTLTYGEKDATTTNLWNTGDTTAAAGTRTRIFYGNDTFAGVGSTDCVMLNRDVLKTSASSIPRVETISIYSADWFNNGDVLKVYIDAPLDADLLTGNDFTAEGDDAMAAAIVQVDVMRRYDGADYHYGTWYAPLNTYEDTIEVIDIEFTAPGTFTFNSANSASWLNEVTPANDGGIRSIIWE